MVCCYLLYVYYILSTWNINIIIMVWIRWVVKALISHRYHLDCALKWGPDPADLGATTDHTIQQATGRCCHTSGNWINDESWVKHVIGYQLSSWKLITVVFAFKFLVTNEYADTVVFWAQDACWMHVLSSRSPLAKQILRERCRTGFGVGFSSFFLGGNIVTHTHTEKYICTHVQISGYLLQMFANTMWFCLDLPRCSSFQAQLVSLHLVFTCSQRGQKTFWFKRTRARSDWDGLNLKAC